MVESIASIDFTYPSCLSELTLGTWIDFTNTCKDVDANFAAIMAKPDTNRKVIELSANRIERAYTTLAFFAQKDLSEVKDEYYVEDAVLLYEERIAKIFEVIPKVEWPYQWNNAAWLLPFPFLTASSTMSFGEFIDSKVLSQNAEALEQSKWELLQYICAIFLRHIDEPYNEAFVDESNGRYQSMRVLPMHIAVAAMNFFEELNKFITENFPLFHESDHKEGAAMKEHFKQWGWVNFLKSIAKTKVFDIPNGGMNSIECARSAKCYEVLIFASEEKDYNLAAQADMEAMYKK